MKHSLKRFIVFAILCIAAVACERITTDRLVISKDHVIQFHIPHRYSDNAVYPSPWSKSVPRFTGEFPCEQNNGKYYEIERRNLNGQINYIINGQAYIELLNNGMDTGLDGEEQRMVFQRWSMDCAFLEFAGDSAEYRVYIPASQVDEVVVLSNEYESLLLAQKDSVLLDQSQYRSDLFNVYCFDGEYYTLASRYPQIMEAICSKKAEKVSMPPNAWYQEMSLTMESSICPGLSFSVHYYRYGKEQYVYNAGLGSLVKVDGPLPSFESQDENILIAQTSGYQIGKHYAKWNNSQPIFIERYVQNWRAGDNHIKIRETSEDHYEINSVIYQRFPLAESNQKGWKADLAFFQEFGKSEDDKNCKLLTGINIESDDVIILYSEDAKELIVKQNCNLATGHAAQIECFGLCWINNGIILPAADAKMLLGILRNKQNETDVTVRFESTEYPGMYYCGWVSMEQYECMFPEASRG